MDPWTPASSCTAVCDLPAGTVTRLALEWASPAMLKLAAQLGRPLRVGDDLLALLEEDDRRRLVASLAEPRRTDRGAHRVRLAGEAWDVEMICADGLVLVFTPSRADADAPGRLPPAQLGELAASLLDLLPNPVFVKDRAHRWIFGNTAFWGLLGVESGALLGRSDYDLFPPDQAEVFWRKDEEVFVGQRPVYNEEALTADGATRWIYTGKIPIALPDGTTGLVGVITDITRRKIAEEQLLQNIEARDRAIEASQTKSQFLANMSHELRTPLNVIIGYTELVLEALALAEQPEAERDLQRVRGAATHLLSLIDDVLDLSRVEAGQIRVEVESFRLAELFAELREALSPALGGRILDIELAEADLEVSLDRLRLKQILLNLLTNAVKFAHQGPISLRAAVDGDDLEIEVEDQGPGIAAADIPRIFRPFERLKEHHALVAGTGLGLSVTRHLCQLMDGDVSVRSELGSGSSFVVRVPRRLSLGESPPVGLRDRAEPRAQPLHRPDRPTALVVDDDEAAYQLIERFSGSLELNVLWTSSGERCVEIARSSGPDLIVLDVLMPDRDGWSVLRALREARATAEVPVLVLTFSDERERAAAFPRTTFLRKPITRNQWLAVVQNYLGEERIKPSAGARPPGALGEDLA